LIYEVEEQQSEKKTDPEPPGHQKLIIERTSSFYNNKIPWK